LTRVIRVIRPLLRFNASAANQDFSCHLVPHFLQYIGERPEMISHDEEPKKARTNQKQRKTKKMKRLMKRIISTLTSATSLATLLGLAMMIAISGTARADCGLQ